MIGSIYKFIKKSKKDLFGVRTSKERFTFKKSRLIPKSVWHLGEGVDFPQELLCFCLAMRLNFAHKLSNLRD